MPIRHIIRKIKGYCQSLGKAQQRTEKRYDKKVPVCYKFSTKDCPWGEARTLNISENGACIVVSHPVYKGQELEIEIPHVLAKHKEISRITGKVAWVDNSLSGKDQYRCGISFQNKNVRFKMENHPLISVADKHIRYLDKYVKDCVVRPAESVEELKVAYKLIYQEYAPRELCRPRATHLHYNFYNMLPATRTLLLKKNEDYLGTISLIPDSAVGLPMETLYPEEIKKLRNEGRHLAEIGALALNSHYFNKKKYSFRDLQKQAHFFKVAKSVLDYARNIAKVTDVVIGVHPKHEFHYKYMNFETVGQERTYQVVGKQAILMRLNFDTFKRNTILFNEGFGTYLFRDTGTEHFPKHSFRWTSQSIKDFLFEINQLWDHLSLEQKEHLMKSYPLIKENILVKR